MLGSGKDIELAHAYLGLTIKTHGPELTKSPTFRNNLSRVQELQKKAWAKLETKLFYNLAVIQALKNT